MLLGNLGADPELRAAGSTSVLKLRMGCSERFKDKSDTWQERTEWVNVVIFGRRADALAKFLSKGSKLFVEGSLRTSTYDDRDGNKRYRTEVIAREIILAGGKRDGGSSGGAPRSDDTNRTGGGGYDDADYGSKSDDSDIPF
jgi:single-strand DNA-binding protein